MAARGSDVAHRRGGIRPSAVVLVLNLGLVAALVVVGLALDSLAMFAAGADYLADDAAIGAGACTLARPD